MITSITKINSFQKKSQGAVPKEPSELAFEANGVAGAPYLHFILAYRESVSVFVLIA